MSRIPDRKKLRREYVEKKAGAYASGMVWSALFLPSTLITIALAIATIWCGAMACGSMFRHDEFKQYLAGTVVFAVGTTVFGVYSRIFWVGIQEARKTARIPHVPPVTAAALPAEEVLVRGAEAPAVLQSQVLLRAVQGNETPKEELLRASIDGNNGPA